MPVGEVLVAVGTTGGSVVARLVHPELNVLHGGWPTAVVEAHKGDGVLAGGEIVVKLRQHHLDGERTVQIGVAQVQCLIVVVIDLQGVAGTLVLGPVGGVGIQRQVSVDERPETGTGQGHDVTGLVGVLVSGHGTDTFLRRRASIDIAGAGTIGGEGGGGGQDTTSHESE